jgi:hypothetical protein
MSVRTLMRISAVVAIPYGLLCLLAPEWWLGLFGGLTIAGEPAGLLGRMYGGQVLGFGALSALVSRTPDSPSRRAVVTGFALVDTVSLGLALWARLSGRTGPEGWLDVLGFAFFAGGFGWFALKPERAGP